MLSLQLNAKVDWNIYSTADQIHKRIQAVAEANRGEAIRKAHKDAAAAAASSEDDASLAVDDSLPALDWLHLRWAPSPDAPHDTTDIQVLRATNPHVNDRATMHMRLGSSTAGRLLTWWMQPAAAPNDSAAAASVSASSSPSAPPAAPTSRSALDPLRVLLNFGEHGREIISSEIALRLVGMLDIAEGEAAAAASAAAAAAASGSNSAASASPSLPELSPLFASWLLSHVDLTIVPLLNVWSHRRIEEGHLCERKNQHGVDLNRNWNYLWNRGNRGASTDRNDDQYPGPSAFSELESKVLRDLAHEVAPELYINYHSGIREMYCGWDHRSDLIPNAAEVLKLLRFVSTKYCKGCPVGGAGAIGGYVVYGGSMDYIYDTLRASYALTVEVFGGARGVHPSNCIEYFNPLTAESLRETTEEWARMSIESMAFLVREKKGVSYPYEIDAWMKPAGAGAGAATDDASNHYSTFRELMQSLDASPALRRLKLGSESSNAALKRTSWNDGCTPFLPAVDPLPSFRAASHLPMWSTAVAAGSSDSSSSDLRVLFVAGAVWNDLLSTQMLCSWITSSGLSSSSSSLKIFVVPSLFSAFRQRVLEVPSMHPGFCSAALSADSKVQVLATQLAAAESLLRLMRERIQPHIVVHLSSERFVPRAGVLGSPPQQSSFHHVEASSLLAGDAEAEGLMLHRMQALLQQTITAAASSAAAAEALSWTLRTHAESLAALHDSASGSDPMRCEIGAIDVPRLLLTPRHQPQQCPSCRLLLTVYLHGAQQEQSLSSPIISIVAERAESSWTNREREELQSRAKSDRVPPAEYRRARSATSAFETQAAAAVAAESKRSVGMIGDRPSPSSSSPSSSWCDFSPRNLPAHTPESVLGLHVAHSNQLWSSMLMRGVLEPLGRTAAREDAALWNARTAATASDAASAPSALEFVPPPWIGIALSDLPRSMRSDAAAAEVALLSEPSLRADPSDINAAASEAAAVLAGHGSSVSTQSYTRILDRSRRVGISIDEGFSASQSMTVMLMGMMILLAIVAWIAANARRRQQQKNAAEANSRRVHV